MDVADTTVKDMAAAPPKDTAVVPVKFVPVMLTELPPTVYPLLGLTPVTVGDPALLNVNWSANEVVEVPLTLDTVISTVAAVSGGLTAVIDVSELIMKLDAGEAPKRTVPAPVKLLPDIATEVPPAVLPEVGDNPITCGLLAAA
jgi:hypothetical protein